MTTEQDKPESEAKTEKDAKEPKANGAHAADTDEPADEASAGADDPTEAKQALDDARGEDGELAEPKAAKSDDDAKDGEPDLVPPGNPLRWKRGLVALAGGGVPAFLLMAKNGQNAWGVPVGFLFILIAAWGVMDIAGTFDDAAEKAENRTTLGELAGPLVRFGALLVAFAGAIAAAQASFGPTWLGAITVTGTFIGLVATVFDLGRTLGPWKKDELGLERPLFHRHGFWVLAVGAVLYFPALGLYSLWDPWETHYGEVAREILARDDWVSLWWAQDGWFWSKPILNFWIQSLSMATLGTHYRPDQMLIGAGGLANAHPEWAVRTPVVLMTLGAMYVLYKGVSKVFGRRAGLLGAIVLATMPDWFFIAHQTMTDMPFVAAMTAAMGLLLVGLNTDEGEKVRIYEVEAFGIKWKLSLWHLVFGIILVCALPQILYLLSRNIELVVFGDGPKGFRIHWDEFKSGSAVNCGLPGNEICNLRDPASIPKSVGARPITFQGQLVRYFGGFEPSLQAIVWGGILFGLLWLNWGERRTRRLVYIAAWFCAAIATMAKGPAGFGLPIICACAYVATKKRWSELLRLEMMSGVLVILCVALPWYVAMYVRHGSPFTDRLIFHDMFNRAFSHVHDTNEGDDTGIRYYAWQLGYALFPWTGIVPLALLWGFRRSDSAIARITTFFAPKSDKPTNEPSDTAGEIRASAVGDASVMLVMWFVFAFALFTFMGTKFHHYIFPAVPPAAMLVGIVLDDYLGQGPIVKKGMFAPYVAILATTGALAAWGFSRMWAGGVFGAVKDQPAASTAFGLAVGVLALAGAGAAIWVLRSTDAEPALAGDRATANPDQSPYRGGDPIIEGDADEARRKPHENLMLGGGAIAGALLLALVGRDLAFKPEGAEQPGAIRLLQLFTYNYRRQWPDSLDFSAILGGITIVAIVLAIALSVKAVRKHAVVAFAAFAFVWAVWGTDVYMVKTAQHWGQHEVIEAYYRDRKGPEEQLVAYQMNWKGENFYTGNRIPAFVSSGANFTNWLKKEKDKGAKVMYFVTEHGRTGGLRSEVNAKSYKEITDRTTCNKFVVVRAEL